MEQTKPKESKLAIVKWAADGALQQINKLVDEKTLILPPNYAVGNAIQDAQLILADKPDIIDGCTKESIYLSIKNMAQVGLSPSKTKQQCYFVKYGNQCTLMISYFGYVAIAKRVDPTIEDIPAHPIKKGEEFDFEVQPDGYYKILKHKPTLGSMAAKEDDCLGAYATIIYNDGKPPKSLVMSWDEIKASWSKSPVKPIDENGKLKKSATHWMFFNDMVKKTVIAKITKPIINTADDSYLFVQAFRAIELESESAKADAAILQADENTGEIIDADYEVAEE